jgi:hypothetical protein
MESLPRDDETAEEYARRIRRERWRRRFIVMGVVALCIAALGIYAAMTVKPIAKIGESCGGADKIECESHAWCWAERGDTGTCLKACAPNIDDKCPAGTSCELFDTVGASGSWNGRTFACRPTRP